MPPNRIRLAIFALATPLIMAACAASGERFSGPRAVSSGTVQIVVFRPDMFLDGGIPYELLVNGKVAGTLRNAGYLTVETQPGTLLVEIQAANLMQRLSFDKVSLSLSGDGNARVYVRASPKLGTVIPAFSYVGRTRFLQAVSEAEAVEHMRDLKQSE